MVTDNGKSNFLKAFRTYAQEAGVLDEAVEAEEEDFRITGVNDLLTETDDATDDAPNAIYLPAHISCMSHSLTCLLQMTRPTL